MTDPTPAPELSPDEMAEAIRFGFNQAPSLIEAVTRD